MTALDADRWTGPPAPEGSPERIEARRRLWDMARRQVRMLERPADEWVADVRRYAPQLWGAVGGAPDVERIARVAGGRLGS